ncbi:hypothetical protein AwPolaro_02470 [Polaromonas sp.]|nr:hypothetical protein AwPolaro_02470 [Polaromonas sp.]
MLMKIIYGSLKPEAGSMAVDGQPVECPGWMFEWQSENQLWFWSFSRRVVTLFTPSSMRDRTSR